LASLCGAVDPAEYLRHARRDVGSRAQGVCLPCAEELRLSGWWQGRQKNSLSPAT